MSAASRVILHIGLHKTATTYLQYGIFPYLSQVRYIHGNKFFQQWQTQVQKEGLDLLLSYEGFSGIAWNQTWLIGKQDQFHWMDSFKSNIESLRLFFPHAIVLVFFRRHGDLLVSMYKQYIQEGGVLPLDQFYGIDGVIRPYDLNFESRIDLLKANFQSCFFLNYEHYKQLGDVYVQRFFSAELNLKLEEGYNVNQGKANNSITGSKIEYLRNINRYYQGWPKKIKSGLRYIGWSPRDILQDRLSFWKPRDSPALELLRKKTNEEFEADWDYFVSHEWRYS